MDRVLEKLREHASPTPSRWREVAEYRQANLDWLKEAREIAIKILSKMRIDGITRGQLAEMTGINPDCISQVLKGKEKVSAETVEKIENALEINLITQEYSDRLIY